MSGRSTAGRYFHAVRHLRPGQIFWRLWYRVHQPRLNRSPAPKLRELAGEWQSPVRRPPFMSGPGRFTFLNTTRDISGAGHWDGLDVPRLWLYNLHYFDDLTADGAQARLAWHRDLIERWVADHPGPSGVGWEPYPLSRRVVNWIKWALEGNRLPEAAVDSLAVQVRYLTRRTEVHLYGNHLLANAKALVFAGLFFQGPEADRWLQQGLAILGDQIPEQVLNDGGHCERSPMYHAIVLEDLLDLVNFCRAAATDALQIVTDAIGPMARWLQVMSHPDGEISFFNDAASGVAAPTDVLDGYAKRLGIPAQPNSLEGTTVLGSSGYIRLDDASAVALLDVAPIGPDYLPGHGHADTLSFELSVDGRRLVVNSGTSVYEPGAERLRQRGTPAHSTVTVDRQDSSEVWGAFRVGRRARPFGLAVDARRREVECAHDGYLRLPGRVTHHRHWLLHNGGLEVVDTLHGSWSEAISRFHLHPDLRVSEDGHGPDLVLRIGDRRVRCFAEGGKVRLRPSRYHPEFGRSVDSTCIEVILTTPRLRFFFEWA